MDPRKCLGAEWRLWGGLKCKLGEKEQLGPPQPRENCLSFAVLSFTLEKMGMSG